MYEAGWTSDLGIIALRKWSLDGVETNRRKGLRVKDGVDNGSGGDNKMASGNGIIGVGGWLKDGKEMEETEEGN